MMPATFDLGTRATLFNQSERLRTFISNSEKHREELVYEIEYADSLGNDWLSKQYRIALEELDASLCGAYESLGRTVVAAERLDQ